MVGMRSQQRAETSYRPVNMIIKVPLTINIGILFK